MSNLWTTPGRDKEYASGIVECILVSTTSAGVGFPRVNAATYESLTLNVLLPSSKLVIKGKGPKAQDNTTRQPMYSVDATVATLLCDQELLNNLILLSSRPVQGFFRSVGGQYFSFGVPAGTDASPTSTNLMYMKVKYTHTGKHDAGERMIEITLHTELTANEATYLGTQVGAYLAGGAATTGGLGLTAYPPSGVSLALLTRPVGLKTLTVSSGATAFLADASIMLETTGFEENHGVGACRRIQVDVKASSHQTDIDSIKGSIDAGNSMYPFTITDRDMGTWSFAGFSCIPTITPVIGGPDNYGTVEVEFSGSAPISSAGFAYTPTSTPTTYTADAKTVTITNTMA